MDMASSLALEISSILNKKILLCWSISLLKIIKSFISVNNPGSSLRFHMAHGTRRPEGIHIYLYLWSCTNEHGTLAVSHEFTREQVRNWVPWRVHSRRILLRKVHLDSNNILIHESDCGDIAPCIKQSIYAITLSNTTLSYCDVPYHPRSAHSGGKPSGNRAVSVQ